ncbi:LOW QUALITY PROTEIN: xyloglucan endotransglucosylase/hydrolase protein 9-like [Phalaenopsis equestris]|uniref:LOW QUALITY PROTEIN: xyloglucan endotransglucosylase/hydrolase protein 9-like n=1 Tax=Phalaenopsis equestris TaxID=78828 RepID=UPI0009E34303|nr:LOW QUALITY PROTEIN: xyloglucan endotransglucosylase/hydrolase protein 9-like [Phalaenopsis equestris]
MERGTSVATAAMEFDSRALLAMLVCCALSAAAAAAAGNGSRFDELFQSSWASDHMVYDGELLQLKLDNFSGSGFASKRRYLYGKASAEIKLVGGDSAGTVTAFYMSSEGTNHDEFDFEFLGNTTGEPYLVQTNVYINGTGNREQRNDLWFDPTVDFHTYAILWNPRQVVFLVDETPIRVFQNKEAKGIAFPGYQKMGVSSSLWNADDWATQGGRVKTNWSNAPFVVTYRELKIDGCEVAVEAAYGDELRRGAGGGGGGEGGVWGKEGRYWWKAPEMEELSVHQSHQLMWVREKHLIYDYCSDVARFPSMPPECFR